MTTNGPRYTDKSFLILREKMAYKEGKLLESDSNVQPSPATFGPLAASVILFTVLSAWFVSYCGAVGFQRLVLKKKC